ncbi:hypothetical protein AVEN_820-1 [Araneus ventricosus]|uniref:Uncharacterized protein n=1 Tax=Araneus ventricosus TaxID=182803 RepID=A0A4Y2K772_ARAVE|nr:hypothetical protein AVEN_820-1 [Araneus ventricosus]
MKTEAECPAGPGLCTRCVPGSSSCRWFFSSPICVCLSPKWVGRVGVSYACTGGRLCDSKCTRPNTRRIFSGSRFRTWSLQGRHLIIRPPRSPYCCENLTSSYIL